MGSWLGHPEKSDNKNGCFPAEPGSFFAQGKASSGKSFFCLACAPHFASRALFGPSPTAPYIVRGTAGTKIVIACGRFATSQLWLCFASPSLCPPPHLGGRGDLSTFILKWSACTLRSVLGPCGFGASLLTTSKVASQHFDNSPLRTSGSPLRRCCCVLVKLVAF